MCDIILDARANYVQQHQDIGREYLVCQTGVWFADADIYQGTVRRSGSMIRYCLWFTFVRWSRRIKSALAVPDSAPS